MMKEFDLTISTPDGNMFQDKAIALIVRGTEGELAVLAGHAPFITSLVECDARIELVNDKTITGHCLGGILTVNKNKVILLSSSFQWK